MGRHPVIWAFACGSRPRFVWASPQTGVGELKPCSQATSSRDLGQKPPKALLARILRASSSDGDVGPHCPKGPRKNNFLEMAVVSQ